MIHIAIILVWQTSCDEFQTGVCVTFDENKIFACLVIQFSINSTSLAGQQFLKSFAIMAKTIF
jgi:hypothetical protein